MKSLPLVFTLAACLFLSVAAKAQSNAEYFAGKWAVTVFGTPGGDSKIHFLFTNTDGKLTGVVQDTTGKLVSEISKIAEKDKSITADFRAQNYDVSITLEPVAADSVKGSLLNMFDAKGVRIKEEH
ncbi:MAG: hypothetical protein INR69_06515 [Mucilaginibacter polytrichastri]|nr:hypothetical protein [Mucilaginibacter polytrichastri]